MAATKRKISISVDAEYVDELRESGSLSAQINELCRQAIEHKRHMEALGRFLDDEQERLGPPDEARVQEFMNLMR